jgi:DNA adenine methylase
MTAPTRPVLRWHGGKFRDRKRIVAHFPPHRVYVEPFGGAASVLLAKPRAYAEVYNDLDREVVELFRVLRDPARAAELIRALELTPFARGEFDGAYEPSGDPVEAARRLCVRSYQGFGSTAHARPSAARTGFRSNSTRAGGIPAHEWVTYPQALRAVVARLAGVVIECKPAIEVMARYDGAETLFYLDPPYLPETRSLKNPYDLKYRRGIYAVEMTRDDHVELLAFVRGLQGMVVLSGYPSALYDDALADWHRVEWAARADGARKRTEVLWINPAARAGRDLFAPRAGAAPGVGRRPGATKESVGAPTCGPTPAAESPETTP